MSVKCLSVKLDVLPRRARFPAVEAGHIEQHAHFSVLPDESLEFGHKIARNLLLPASR